MNRVSSKIFIIACLLVATFMSVTHHHNDLKKHGDCTVCDLSVNLLGNDVVNTHTSIREENYFIRIISCEIFLYIFTLYYIPLPRAPPFFSYLK